MQSAPQTDSLFYGDLNPQPTSTNAGRATSNHLPNHTEYGNAPRGPEISLFEHFEGVVFLRKRERKTFARPHPNLVPLASLLQLVSTILLQGGSSEASLLFADLFLHVLHSSGVGSGAREGGPIAVLRSGAKSERTSTQVCANNL